MKEFAHAASESICGRVRIIDASDLTKRRPNVGQTSANRRQIVGKEAA
jgi:hypothetical protein